jgi:hypothetical protein
MHLLFQLMGGLLRRKAAEPVASCHQLNTNTSRLRSLLLHLPRQCVTSRGGVGEGQRADQPRTQGEGYKKSNVTVRLALSGASRDQLFPYLSMHSCSSHSSSLRKKSLTNSPIGGFPEANLGWLLLLHSRLTKAGVSFVPV